MQTITLNIGGTLFTTCPSTLQKFPESRLAKLSPKISPEYNKVKDWYFFDRNGKHFDAILDLYRMGELHLPSNICGATMRNEMEFWDIPLYHVADCCYGTICSYDDKIKNMQMLKSVFDDEAEAFPDAELRQSRINRCRNMVWNFLFYPRSSLPALIYSVVYFLLVFISILIFILNTHPCCRRENDPIIFDYQYENVTYQTTYKDYLIETHENPKNIMYFTTTEYTSVYYIEYLCAAFFGIEVILTIVCSPNRKKLFKCFIFYLDAILVVTNIITFAFEKNPQVFKDSKLLWFYIVLKAFVIFRLARLARLGRHIGGLKVLVLAVKSSLKELGLLLLSFFIAVTLSSGIMYYAEYNEHHTFSNVPVTMWWSVITMTTVGYGDFTPSSPTGYILGSVCAISGILIVAMPIAVIANSFSEFYTLNNVRENKKAAMEMENSAISMSSDNGHSKKAKMNRKGSNQICIIDDLCADEEKTNIKQ